MAKLKEKIEEQLLWDNRIDSSGIEVEVQNGKVTLRGTVPGHTDRMAAELDCWHLSGVKGVQNLLKIEYAAATGVPQDNELKNNIEHSLEWDAAIDSTNIEIRVRGGMAELKGSVDAFWKKKKVEEIVKDTAGVVDVRNELTVVPTHDITDEVVGRNIMEAIDRNYRLDAESINIKVKDGKVILAGQVPDWRAKVALYDIALHTGGVIDVQDEMEVKGEGE